MPSAATVSRCNGGWGGWGGWGWRAGWVPAWGDTVIPYTRNGRFIIETIGINYMNLYMKYTTIPNISQYGGVTANLIWWFGTCFEKFHGETRHPN